MENVLVFDLAFYYAILSAFIFSMADFAGRFGIHKTNAFVGTTMTRGVASVILFVAIILTGVKFPPLSVDYLWVMIAGICLPGLFSLLLLTSILKIGVSRAAPIKGSSPLFASFLAILFLGEEPTWYHLLGVVFVVFGVILISLSPTEGQWKRKDIIWPISAALISGIGSVTWRHAMSLFKEPIAATFIGTFSAFVLVVTFTSIFKRKSLIPGIKAAWKPFFLMGFFAAVGVLLYVSALQKGNVYRISSLVQTSPLITVFFSFIFLRKIENISWRVPIGAVITLTGVALVNSNFQ
tara:strand:+ start:1133 stop:2017 length:885 start_codon:yes stop_codon:yes gene_type:complete